jgi:hypothetical protein
MQAGDGCRVKTEIAGNAANGGSVKGEAGADGQVGRWGTTRRGVMTRGARVGGHGEAVADQVTRQERDRGRRRREILLQFLSRTLDCEAQAHADTRWWTKADAGKTRAHWLQSDGV